jgi:hypothetical protein
MIAFLIIAALVVALVVDMASLQEAMYRKWIDERTRTEAEDRP